MSVHLASTRNAGGSASEPDAIVRLARVPCNLLGMLLDHGKDSATAAHLLAIKTSGAKGSGHALNATYMNNRYGIGWRRFQAGIALLKRTGVLDRTQTGRRTYAKEELADPSRNFVMIREDVLERSSALVAFVLVVNLSPEPMRPADAARKIGVTAPATIRKLTQEAIEVGAVANMSPPGARSCWRERASALT